MARDGRPDGTDDSTPAGDGGEAPTCERCGEPRPPGPDLCPVCEDLQAGPLVAPPDGGPGGAVPPHGNATR